MKYMSGKAKMMVAGIGIGVAETGILAILIAAGKIGFWGAAAVGCLIVLSGFSGWMLGIQMRVQADHERAWMRGYQKGRGNRTPVNRFIAIFINSLGR